MIMKLKIGYFRKGIMFLFKLLILVLTAGIYFTTSVLFYQKSIYENKGNYMLVLLYVFIFLLLMHTYQGFRIGINSRKELIFSYLLTIFLTNFAAYLVAMLVARSVLNPLPLLGMTFVQWFVASLLYILATAVYFRLYPVRDTMVISSGTSKELDIAKKFGRIKNRYNIELICSETMGYDALIEEIPKYSVIIICDIDYALRQRLLAYCFENGKRLFIVPTLQDIMLNRAHETQIGDSLVYLCKNRTFTMEQMAIKRIFDILFSVIGLTIASPIMLATAIAIKLHDGGPVFFKQKRYTRNKKVFTLIKFRSMIVDAEKNGAQFTTDDDDRITPVGRFIRKTRIDELPQLLNILRGEMSLVGPRPERIENVEAYCQMMPEFEYRLKVKAGLTGYAQVYGKYNTTFEEKVKMDMLYIEHMSLLMDLQLLFATVKVMFMKESTEGFDEENIEKIKEVQQSFSENQQSPAEEQIP